MVEVDLTFVDDAVGRIGTGKDRVLELLQAAQGHYGFLPVEVGADVVASMHGDAEKFPADGLGRGVRLMYLILREFLAP